MKSYHLRKRSLKKTILIDTYVVYVVANDPLSYTQAMKKEFEVGKKLITSQNAQHM